MRWSALRARRPWVAHAADAWRRLQDNHGSQFAGAITYFSFLALFPLLLLVVAVTGYVLHAHPAVQQSLLDHITANVPGDLGKTLRSSVQTAIDARAGVGLVGLAGLLFTGLGWIRNLRAAIDAVWGRRTPKRGFVATKAADLVVLAGLGFGTAVSLGLSVVGTSATDQLVRAVGWEHVNGLPLLFKATGTALAFAGDLLIFGWLLIWLPAAQVPSRIGWGCAALAAAGFAVLKIVGTYTIAHTAHSPTAGPFAGLVAVLIWIQLVVRYLLFCVALTATLTAARSAMPAVPAVPAGTEPEPAPGAPDEPVVPERPLAVSPAAVGVALVGVGVVAGAALGAAAVRRRRGGTG